MESKAGVTAVFVIVAAVIFLPMMKPTSPPASPLPIPTPEQRELREKVGKLGMRITFTRYDADNNGKLDAGELRAMLTDANVGNIVTRGTWVTSILATLDTDKDGMVSWAELLAGFNR